MSQTNSNTPFTKSGFGILGASEVRPGGRPAPESFLGLWVSGDWHECNAMLMAKERGSTVMEELEICQAAGVPLEGPGGLDHWLAVGWKEHNIHAVAAGTEDCAAEESLTVVRQCGHWFQVRLFSPSEELRREWAERSQKAPWVM